ncbi:S-protein homolog 5-like [Cicer arietinum]|uniref:S-protein homolog n=1 Tax=Cicer arietinum TaxID=3827 RepID=A0A1S3E4Z4_CICAR|nr:S-protein homolog 5-like [Cicer arietinum]
MKTVWYAFVERIVDVEKILVEEHSGECSGEYGESWPTRAHVYVTNNITNYQLGVECKDKNSNFGFRALQFGESYSFSFMPKYFIPRSLYFCKFSWKAAFHRFDIYIQTRDQPDCDTHCQWLVNESGPCKIKTGSVVCFHWNDVVIGGRQLDQTIG